MVETVVRVQENTLAAALTIGILCCIGQIIALKRIIAIDALLRYAARNGLTVLSCQSAPSLALTCAHFIVTLEARDGAARVCHARVANLYAGGLRQTVTLTDDRPRAGSTIPGWLAHSRDV